MVNKFGFDTIHLAIPEKTHFESRRNAAEDQYGLINLATPSYNMCQPTITRQNN